MRETYTQNEASRALGVTRRTLYEWLKAAGVPTGTWSSKQRVLLTSAEVEQLASKHKRNIQDIDVPPRDALQEISQLREQIAQQQEQAVQLEARVLRIETQLQTITSLLGNRLSLGEKADEQKNDTSC